MAYSRRAVDAELDDLLPALPALSLEGPRGVGKTSTASQRGGDVVRLDDPAVREVIAAQPDRLLTGRLPVVVDEWQRWPESWDVVRRAVDDDPSPGRFLLTGSATPTSGPTHSGAGRIVVVRMRPLTLVERGMGTPTVSLAGLLAGGRDVLDGATPLGLDDYVDALLTGGFPAMQHTSRRAQRAALDSYLDRVVDADLPEIGTSVRRPQTLRRWLRAYAAAVATTASYEAIRDAATPGEDDKPAKTTTMAYREVLERVWLLDPLPAWAPTRNHLRRLTGAPKHHLADPALAARLVGLDREALLGGEQPGGPPRDGTYLGALFESLAALTVRVFAQSAEASVGHLRTKAGDREIDLIVHRPDGRVLALETKLSQSVSDRDVRHLRWLGEQLGPDLLDAAVLTTGTRAYRRPDGIAVVPLALLGP